jgi:hypothetical protein
MAQEGGDWELGTSFYLSAVRSFSGLCHPGEDFSPSRGTCLFQKSEKREAASSHEHRLGL